MFSVHIRSLTGPGNEAVKLLNMWEERDGEETSLETVARSIVRVTAILVISPPFSPLPPPRYALMRIGTKRRFDRFPLRR